MAASVAASTPATVHLSCASARARNTRCCWPPERLEIGVGNIFTFFKALSGNLAVFLPRPLKQAEMPAPISTTSMTLTGNPNLPIHAGHIAHTAEIILYRLAKDLDPAAAHQQQSRSRLDQGGFSCAVGANPRQLPSRNLNIHPPQHRRL